MAGPTTETIDVNGDRQVVAKQRAELKVLQALAQFRVKRTNTWHPLAFDFQPAGCFQVLQKDSAPPIPLSLLLHLFCFVLFIIHETLMRLP